MLEKNRAIFLITFRRRPALYPRLSAISSLLIEDIINFFKIHKKILTNKKKSDKSYEVFHLNFYSDPF